MKSRALVITHRPLPTRLLHHLQKRTSVLCRRGGVGTWVANTFRIKSLISGHSLGETKRATTSAARSGHDSPCTSAESHCWRSGQEGTAWRLLPPDSDMPPVIAVARVCPILGTRAAAPHSWSFKTSPSILPSYRLLTHRYLVNTPTLTQAQFASPPRPVCPPSQ